MSRLRRLREMLIYTGLEQELLEKNFFLLEEEFLAQPYKGYEIHILKVL